MVWPDGIEALVDKACSSYPQSVSHILAQHVELATIARNVLLLPTLRNLYLIEFDTCLTQIRYYNNIHCKINNIVLQFDVNIHICIYIYIHTIIYALILQGMQTYTPYDNKSQSSRKYFTTRINLHMALLNYTTYVVAQMYTTYTQSAYYRLT